MITFAITITSVVIGWFLIVAYLFGGPHGLALGTELVVALLVPMAMLMLVPLWDK